MSRFSLSIAAVLYAAGPASAQRLFDGGEVFDVEFPAQKILVDDFNGDAKLDVALLQGGHSKVSVYLNGGAPLFQPSVAYETGLSPVAAASGDLDGDGFPELVVVSVGSSSVSTLLNRGDGSFTPSGEFPVGKVPRALGLADFNGDGSLDAAVSDLLSTTAGSLFILSGDGKGGFHDAVTFDVGDNAHALVALDFDADGHADVAVAHSQTVTVLRSADNGTFLPRVDTDLGFIAANPRFLGSGDLDRDGRPDLGVLSDSGLLLFLSNAGGGAFKTGLVGMGAGGFLSARFLLVTDFTGDGRLDFISLGLPGKDATMRVHAGFGDGTFAAPEDLSVGSDLYDLALSDLDGDAASDLLALSGSAGMTLFRGTGSGQVNLHLTVPRDIAASCGLPRSSGSRPATSTAMAMRISPGAISSAAMWSSLFLKAVRSGKLSRTPSTSFPRGSPPAISTAMASSTSPSRIRWIPSLPWSPGRGRKTEACLRSTSRREAIRLPSMRPTATTMGPSTSFPRRATAFTWPPAMVRGDSPAPPPSRT
jgi:hypothetical protein